MPVKAFAGIPLPAMRKDATSMSLADKYAAGAMTIMDWLGDGGIPVSTTLAQQRADACLQCPHNRHSLPMSAIVKAVGESAKLLIGVKNREKLRVNGEKRLGQCERCECWISLKIWTPIDHILQYSGDERMPEYCWQTKEADNL